MFNHGATSPDYASVKGPQEQTFSVESITFKPRLDLGLRLYSLNDEHKLLGHRRFGGRPAAEEKHQLAVKNGRASRAQTEEHVRSLLWDKDG